jgi:hypothetical protein
MKAVAQSQGLVLVLVPISKEALVGTRWSMCPKAMAE